MPIIKRSSGPQSLSSSPSLSSKTASLHPDDFDRTFDILAEIEDNKDLYKGDQWTTLLYFPSYITTCIERVKTEASRHRMKVGASTILSCCISHGLDMISSDSEVKSLIKIKSLIHTTHDVPAIELEELASWFRSFPLSHPDPSASGTRKQTLTLTQDIKSELGETARDLGMSVSSLAVLAISCTLSTEKCMHADTRPDLENALTSFLRRVKIRKKVAEVWLSSLGIKPLLGQRW